MDDAFSQGGGLKLSRRFKKHSHGFSPSFGVRAGFIRDPHWPPPVLPEDGVTPRRRSLRVRCSFDVQLGLGRTLHVQGDLSSGGAMFVAPAPVPEERIQIIAADGAVRARGVVIGRRRSGQGYAHHVRLEDPDGSSAVGQLVRRLARENP